MKVIKSRKVKFLPKYFYMNHKHKNIEIICVIVGKCIVHIDGKDLVVSEGESILINSFVEHSFLVSGLYGCKINQLEIVEENIFILDETLKYLKTYSVEHIGRCLDNINLYLNDKRFAPYCEELINAVYFELKLLFNVFKLQPNHHLLPSSLSSFIEYIKSNFIKDINLAEQAKAVGFTPRYLRKIFKVHFSMSPIDYILALRIEYAKKLLVQTTYNITDIAISSGFNTIQYFSKIFKQKTGISPKDFRVDYKEVTYE